MKLKELIAYLSAQKGQKLPDWEAHKLMAPPYRFPYSEAEIALKKPNVASVLILFFEDEDGEVKFPVILRNEYDGVHSNQISLPGGRYETEDVEHEVTAKREAMEELGVDFNKIEIVLPLSDLYVPPSNFIVHPFIGVYKGVPKYNPNPEEVQEVIDIKLTDFILDKPNLSQEIETSFGLIKMPAYKLNQHIIWGATAMILEECKLIVKNNFY